MAVALDYIHFDSEFFCHFFAKVCFNVITIVIIRLDLFFAQGSFTWSKDFMYEARSLSEEQLFSNFSIHGYIRFLYRFQRSLSISVNGPLRKTVCCRNFLIFGKSLRISRKALHPLSGTNYKPLKPTWLTSYLHRIHGIHLKQVRLRKLRG